MHGRSGCPGCTWLSGFTALVKEITSECESAHCVIHREMLASQKMSPELNNILQDVVKIISHIKVHALNSCLFSQLCEEMDAEHTGLLLHTEVRWLSKGRWLARVFQLAELSRYLFSENSHHWQYISVTENGSQNCLLM